MRRWGKAWDWYDRILGPESDACAVAAYRLLFLRDHGQKEIPEVSSRMGIPISSRPAPLPESIEDVRTASAEVAKEVSRRSDGARAVRERHVKLIDAGIGYIVDQLKQGKVRTSLSDIDTLLKARSRIEADAAPAGAAVFESVRVRAAREAGRDVIEAIEADLGELAVIVAALKTRRAANQSGDIDGYRFTVDDPDALRVVNGSKEAPKSVGSTPLRVVEFDDEENDV
ncbi:MAG: hypothetical protein KGS10_05650 [Chloroflexi bacterium]|nr:hypothetical protein [Chloroflexota bacterium]